METATINESRDESKTDEFHASANETACAADRLLSSESPFCSADHCTIQESSQLTHANLLLLPAMEQELKRVSSCYFSIASEAASLPEDPFVSTNDLLSLWLLEDTDHVDHHDTPTCSSDTSNLTTSLRLALSDDASKDWLFQDDILSQVVPFLDLKSLAAFSETARRPNAACYQHLQYKLDRAVQQDVRGAVTAMSNYNKQTVTNASPDSTLPEDTAAVSRLALLDRPLADEILHKFRENHTSNHTCPQTCHSLAVRLKQMLQQPHLTINSPEPRNLAKAALLFTVLGGAAAAALTGAADASEALVYMEHELPQVLMKLGFVGSLMGAAKTMHSSAAASMNHNGVLAAAATSQGAVLDESTTRRSSLDAMSSLAQGVQDMRRMLMERSALFRMMQASYEGTKKMVTATEGADSLEFPTTISCPVDAPCLFVTSRDTIPCVSGSVGSYVHAIQHARKQVRSIIQNERKSRFDSLAPEQQEQLTRTFLDACRSDESIAVVKELVHSLDVDGFYLGSDGSETCALHAAAFYGATNVLDFLCRGTREEDPKLTCDSSDSLQSHTNDDGSTTNSDEDKLIDGGLCDINRKDKNGWTAAHFCAGSNSVPALNVLTKYGAQLDVEAGNGYTPLQWAVRLQNEQVAGELRRRTGKDGSNWIMSGQPLTAIASRFLAMIPTQTG